MTQREIKTMATGGAIGFVLGTVLGIGIAGNPFGGDKTTEVTLSPIGPNGACVLGKSTQVRVGKSKQLTWEIENYCTDGAKLVSVGNFRRDQAPVAAPDCADAGPDYPFSDANLATRTSKLEPAEAEGDGDVDPTEGRIKLKVKGRNELGDEELIYHFDVCLDGRKVDPMLVIER